MNTRTPRSWADEFTVELRLRGVSGKDIGDSLAEVESFCLDSGESPEAAFGPAGSYAATLQFKDSPQPAADLAGRLRAAAPPACGILGLMLALVGYDSWRAATDVTVTVGTLMVGLLVLAGIGTIAIYFDWLVRKPIRAAALITLVVALAAVCPLLTTPLLSLPAIAVGVAATALLLASALVPVNADPVRPPLTSHTAADRRAIVLGRLLRWTFPALTVISLVIVAIATRHSSA